MKRKGLCVGGPYQGTHLEGEDNGERFVPLRSKGGDVVYYERDTREYPDGVVRFNYARELTEASSQAIRLDDIQRADPDAGAPRVRLRYSTERNRWELSVEGAIVAVAPADEIKHRMDAEAFMRKHVDAPAKLIEAK